MAEPDDAMGRAIAAYERDEREKLPDWALEDDGCPNDD
jgi:hypothetical protein